MQYQILVNKFGKGAEEKLRQFGEVAYADNVGLGLGAGYRLTTESTLSREQTERIMSMPEIDTVHRAETIQ